MMKPLRIDSIVWKVEEPELPGRALASWPSGERFYLEINGLPCHVQALRVEVNKTGEQDAYDETFHSEVWDMQTNAEGQIVSGNLPGLEGEWIIYIHPFGE
jgi:hypothetical protein